MKLTVIPVDVSTVLSLISKYTLYFFETVYQIVSYIPKVPITLKGNMDFYQLNEKKSLNLSIFYTNIMKYYRY